MHFQWMGGHDKRDAETFKILYRKALYSEKGAELEGERVK